MELEYEDTKSAVLTHIEEIFREMEEEAVVSHQEKYSLLEDSFENATDSSEIRVAYEQWFSDHSDEIAFDHSLDEIWDMALARLEDEDEDED